MKVWLVVGLAELFWAFVGGEAIVDSAAVGRPFPKSWLGRILSLDRIGC